MDKCKSTGKLLAGMHMLAIFLFAVLQIETNHENEQLFWILSITFTGLVPLIAALAAGYAYVQKSNVNALLMGCGMLAFGLGSSISGILRFLPDSANLSVTMYNSCAFIGSVCQLAASLKESGPRQENPQNKELRLAVAFCGTCLFVVFLLLALLHGLTPVYRNENGSTAFRDFVLVLAVVFYFSASVEMGRQYRHDKAGYLYWYALSLLMISMGLFSFCMAAQEGTLMIWAGRSAQYVGAVFALFSMLGAIRKAKEQGSCMAEVKADFFADDRGNYRDLAEHTANAVIAVDESFMIFFVNKAATKMFQYAMGEMLGTLFLDLLPEPCREQAQSDFKVYAAMGKSGLSDPVEMTAQNKSGKRIPIEVSASYHALPSGRACTYVISDITQRKRAEEKISQQNSVLKAINRIYECALHWDTVEGLADACLSIIRKTTSSCCGFIGSLEENGRLHALAAYHEGASFRGAKDGMLGIPDQLYDVFHDILDHGEPVLLKLPMQEPSGGPANETEASFVFLGVPCRQYGKVVGMLGIGRREGGFSAEDRYMLDELTPTVFGVLKNKRSEERLLDSEERFSAFMNAGPFIALIKDRDNRFVYANKRWEKETGRPICDSLGKTNTDLLPESAADKVFENHHVVFETGHALETLEWLSKPGQGKHCYSSIWFPFSSKSGQDFVGSITLDVTEQKMAEEALQQKEALLHAVMDGTEDPVFLKDTGGRYMMVNRALSRVLGKPGDRIVGKTDMDIISDHEKAAAIMDSDRQVIACATAQSIEETLPTLKGMRIFLTAKTPWRDEDGSVLGIIGISQDITGRKHMETELMRKTMELEEKNRLITDFFINISHEFKTPLSIILLLSDMMGAEDEPPESGSRARFVKIMRVNAYRLRRLVENLLDITKLDAGFMEPNWETIDVSALMKSLISSTEVYAKQKGIALSLSPSPGAVRMSADSLMLERILLNLLSNAMKHTPPGGEIRVFLKALGGQVTICVSDSGEGIPDEKKSIIFDRFKQVNTSLVRTSEGCGIGLSICKGLVELMGGNIAFQSTLGKGSEFSVTLPALNPAETRCMAGQSGMEMENRIEMELSDIDFG